MLYLPTGPPPSLVQGQEPGSLLQMATLSTPRPSSSKSQLSCLPSRGGDRGREQAPIIIPTPSQLRSPQRQSGSWSRKGYEAGKNNKHILLLLLWPSSIPTSWCRILG